MTMPNGSSGLNPDNVDGITGTDGSIPGQAGNTQPAVVDTLKARHVGTTGSAASVYTNPSGPLQQAATGIAPGTNILLAPFQMLLQALGVIGAAPSQANAGQAVKDQTAMLAAMGAAVSALNTQAASTAAGGTAIAVDPFSSPASTLGANWDVQVNTLPFIGGGHPYCDGTQAVWQAGGFTDATCVARFIGANHTAATDNTETAIVLGNPLNQTGGLAAVDIHDRMSTDRMSSIRARIETSGTAAVLMVHSRVSGAETQIGTTVPLPATPSVGTICKLVCGTATSSRQFLVTIGGTTYPFTETGTASHLGVGYRERGIGWYAGGLFGQLTPGAIAHWTSVDIATPSGAVGGSGAGTTGRTLYFGGGPTDTGKTVLSGGTPTDTGKTLVSGGTP